ncbi:gustatory and pheromone receptor 39a-like [Tribolium madens]|uniref:gustatory and pheromone receptor 39a-like n=1 Tax=Tribolium madens TaxID=41895 RepID=UPI001CF75B7E|nr:gustatory and pheromone receptor 39a-like [Tribolium madens]
MDVKTIKACLCIGKLLAPTQKNHKFYPIIVFFIYTIYEIYSLNQKRLTYNGFTIVQLVLKIVMDVALYFHTFHILVILMSLRRDKWTKLFGILSKFDTQELNPPFYFVVAIHIIFFVNTSLNIWTWVNLIGYYFVKSYLIEFFEIYLLFVCTVSSSVILKILLQKYKHQNRLLTDFSNYKTVKFNLFLLNRAVKIFTEIFGWTILVTIFFSVARTLMYFDLFHKDSISKNFNIRHSWLNFVTTVTTGLLFWILLLYVIFLCDLVSKEFERILNMAYKIETWSVIFDNNLRKKQEIMKDLLKHRPNFSAARFFTIDRSTIFSICNSLTSFLIIIIQFKIN